MSMPPYDDRDGYIWQDGDLVPWRDATCHVLTHGLHYASCVFEGERLYHGHIFKRDEHHQRLLDSARILGFEVPYSVAELNEAANAVARANGIANGYVRPVAWRGSEQMGISAQRNRIHVAIAAWTWGDYFGSDGRLQGIRMRTADWKRPSPETAPAKSKAAGLYMICVLSKHQAEAEGYKDALMLDYRGRIAEATGANIFLVRNGELHTPEPDCFLDGITRRTVMALARERGYTVRERAVMPEELADTDEVFITGTAAEVTPVASIDRHEFTVGAVTRELMGAFEDLVNNPASWDQAPA